MLKKMLYAIMSICDVVIITLIITTMTTCINIIINGIMEV